MPNWFRGRGGEPPREWAAALDKLLAPLDRPRRGLARGARDFVVTGSPVSALTEAAVWRASTGGLLSPWGPPLDRFCGPVFARLGEVDPDIGVRLGKLLEAVAAPYTLGQQPKVRWIEALIVGYANLVIPQGSVPTRISVPLEVCALESLAESEGMSPAEPLLVGFRPASVPSYYGQGRVRPAVRALAGYADAVARHADALRPTLASTKVDQRLIALEMLAGLPPEVLRLFVNELAGYATASSSQVRAASYGPLEACGDAVVPPLRRIAVEGKPEARRAALERLCTFPGERTWALETAADDRAASVRSLTEQQTPSAGDDQPAEQMPTVTIPEIDWRTTVTPGLRAVLGRVVAETNASIEKANRASRAAAERWTAQYGRQPMWQRDEKTIPSHWLDSVISALEAGRPPRHSNRDVPRLAVEHLTPVLMRHLTELGLGAAGLVVVLNEADGLTYTRDSLSPAAVEGFGRLRDTTGGPSLLEISTMLDQLGLDGGDVVLRAYGRRWNPLGRDWPDEAVAPFMLAHLDRVLDLLTPGRDQDWSSDPLVGFAALGSLSTLPRVVVDALFAAALGSRKTERRPAQDALTKVPGLLARVVASLTDGRSEVRALAAEWLGRLGESSAVSPLEVAVRKERQDVALGAMLDALQTLGQPVEQYLDRGALAVQAEKVVAKGVPAALGWFGWNGTPEVHWETGEVVPGSVLQWMLVQGVRSKSPVPNAVMRKYCAMFDARDRERFGQYVLESWIAEDVRPIDPEDARQQATTWATQMHQSFRNWPQHYQNDPLRNASLEQLIAAYLPGFLKQPAGSAAASKGMLAVAAACAGERAAVVVQRYLKEWYGQRAAQGRALIVMLAWIEHPTATQLMLSVGSRFRTKSFQDEATTQAELLAERKGWTLGELADRTIPTAGLDESGILELSYGERVFTAQLLPDLSLELHAPDGSRIKALPAPRQSDDEAAAKEAKKALSLAKKEIKGVAQLQSERLYEGLCTERTWAYDDWDRYLNRHPIMRLLTQRLAWTATSANGDVMVFRPLDDGSLTDVDDAEVRLADDARIAVAHDSNLDADAVAAWLEHFADYDVTPLFQQLGKGAFALPAERARETRIADFEGHLVEAFALRGRATKLGYTRGQSEDGGWFYTYSKRFPTLGITAEVEFTGNFLPEENRTVALRTLGFVPQGTSGSGTAMRLADVPEVLLSETWNDLRLMAADGSGFDAEWERKVEY